MAQIPYSKGGDDFKPWPEGTYDWMIKKVEQTTSKQEKPQLSLTLEGVGNDAQSGKTMRDWRSLVPEAAFRIEALIKATGCPEIDTGEKDASGKPVMTFDTDDLVGRYFRGTLTHRPHNGKVFADIGDECPSPIAPKGMTGTTEEADAPADGAGAPAETPPAQPSASGAPAVGRRPRPAPAS